MFKYIKSHIIRQYAIVFIVNFSLFTNGINLAWPSPMLVKLSNETQTNLHRTITVEEGSWIVSVEFVCALFVNPVVALLLDGIGRKYCILSACLPKIAGVLLYIFAKDVWALILGRLMFGFSDSLLFVGTPIYASEIATKKTRGVSCTLLQMFSSLGIVLTLSTGPFTSYLTFNIILAVAIIATSLPILLLPESPYFLYSKGRENDAIEVLKFLHGSELLAKQEMKEYTMSTKSEKINKMALLKNPTVRKSLLISLIFSFGCQFVGYNTVSYYLQTILISTNSSIMPEIASVIIGLIQFMSSILTTFTTDRFGRKIILTVSLIGMSVGMIGLGTFFKLKPLNGESMSGFLNYLPLVSLIIAVYCSNAGLATLIWVLIPELFDGPARAFGVAVNLGVNTCMIFLTTKYFPAVISELGPAITYWCFGCACLLLCLFIIFFIPETKGKSFIEIQGEIGKKETNSEDISTAL